MISDDKKIPFNDLKLQFGLIDTEFLSYLQIKSVMKPLLSKEIRNKKDLENKFRGIAIRKGAVSAMYKLLCSAAPDRNSQTKLQWECDIGVPISLPQWDRALTSCTKMSKCVRSKIIQIKI